MKTTLPILGLILAFFTQGCFLSETKTASAQSADNGWKNFYGISWRGTPADNIRYAKQMGYDYIAINQNASTSDYRGNPNAAGLKFYIEDPFWYATVLSGHGRNIDTTRSYTAAERAWYEQRMVWKSNDTFPYNLATGCFNFGTPTIISIMWDFQQQAVIDEVVEKVIALFRSYEDASLPFTFAGFIDDVSILTGHFFIWENNDNVQTTLANWTGVDSGLVHSNITHEYATYTEGLAAYYKQLTARMRQEFPNAKWIMEPGRVYFNGNSIYNWVIDECIYQIKDRADRNELTPDMLSQESGNGTWFIDDINFNSGVSITRDEVGISQISQVDESQNRLFAATCGINGAWYNWVGRFGGVETMPDFQRITAVYPRLKLIRCLPNWDNLNNIPLVDRSWDGTVYRSTKSYADPNVMYSRHPKTGKLFAVFITHNGVIKLNPGETVTSVQRVDGYFMESGDGSADVTIVGDEIRLRSEVSIPSSNGQSQGRGYIFTLLTNSMPDGSIIINSGADYIDSTTVTLALSATDNTGVTGHYLSTSSSVPSASAPGWTMVTSATSYSANIPYTLSSGDGSKTVYAWYKDAAGNVSTTASDSITLDTTDPAVTITSPTSNSTYATTSGTVSLGGSASDSRSGVNSVTWSNNRGGSGTASGTTSWSISGIPLFSGDNIITVTARDRANNTNSDIITATCTTGDTTPPNCSVIINGGNTYTDSTTVTLALSATDTTGVTGYYLSTSSSVPLASAPGWTTVASSTSYNANVPYTLSSGDGSKTVYAWYKDAAGNVSTTASDSITLDTTDPAVTITSPTSNSTYTTTSGTVSLGGSASDSRSGVNSVTWSNNRGGSGTASGTTSWSISGITLFSGDNIITVTARDRANNTNSDTITVSVPQTTIDATALYNFNEGSGTIATDSSGNGNNGTIYGASWTTGRSGGGLSFDGTNDYVNLGDPLSLQPNTVSVSVWFKTTDSNGIILRKRLYGYGLDVWSSGRISFWIYNSAATLFRARSPLAYNDNIWHHAVGVYDGSRVRLYIDGVQVASASAGTICYAAGGIAIGRDGNSNGSYFRGLVDGLSIYNRALSSQEISDLFNAL
ncbi:MAG: hypothetical protein B6D35_14630 [Candidatus Brocadia sp. UTAMX2]|jgi:hypothetical protein|nr:MAG: hypothetical protein B6D35_14630 [Candidatus Brocadia sp. UTAMX2]